MNPGVGREGVWEMLGSGLVPSSCHAPGRLRCPTVRIQVALGPGAQLFVRGPHIAPATLSPPRWDPTGHQQPSQSSYPRPPGSL